MALAAHSTVGPRRAHPLAGPRFPGAPTIIVILIGWLSVRGWTCEQITALLLVILPTISGVVIENE